MLVGRPSGAENANYPSSRKRMLARLMSLKISRRPCICGISMMKL